MLDFRKNKFMVHLLKCDCLKPGISVPLSSAPGEMVCEEIKPIEAGSGFKRSDVFFLGEINLENSGTCQKKSLSLTTLLLPVAS